MNDRTLLRSSVRRPFVAAAFVLNLGVWLSLAIVLAHWKRIDLPSIILLALALLLLVKFFRSGTFVSKRGVEVRRVFGHRSIPWEEVLEVAKEETPLGRRISILLRNGKKVRLSAPGDWWPGKDRDFDEGFQKLMNSWKGGGVGRTA